MLSVEQVWRSNRNMRRVADGEEEIDVDTFFGSDSSKAPVWLDFTELPTLEEFMRDPPVWRETMSWVDWDQFVGYVPDTTVLFRTENGLEVMAVLLGSYILFQCDDGGMDVSIRAIKPSDAESLFKRIKTLGEELHPLLTA